MTPIRLNLNEKLFNLIGLGKEWPEVHISLYVAYKALANSARTKQHSAIFLMRDRVLRVSTCWMHELLLSTAVALMCPPKQSSVC